jgi:hypothetical protein
MADTSNTADVIDSRDVIARIEELENNEERTEHEAIELVDLRKLATYGESYIDDWQYGAQLVRESYFETHAHELADDCGMISRDAKWPHTCIDWKWAARELMHDYTALDYDGVTYYVR